ncbi:MAG: PilW family protein [Thermochromatium sp.]
MNRQLHHGRGFSLTELMVALALGLLVTAAVIGVFLSNQQIHRQNEGLARMQESARYAFEVLARDLREAGGIACGRLDPSNVLNNASSYWWEWDKGPLRGVAGDSDTFPKPFGTTAASRVSGTDAILILSGTSSDGVYLTHHNHATSPFQFTVNSSSHPIQTGDILVVCDYNKAAIFQTTTVSGATLQYTTGSGTPGNASLLLDQQFNRGGFITRLSATGWYIGYNGRGGRSLYRLRLQNASGSPADVFEEIAEGVTDLTFEYLQEGGTGYVAAGSVTNWQDVIAVRLTLTTRTQEKVGTNQQPLERQWFTVVTLRNRQS